jgi:hypothetical protein
VDPDGQNAGIAAAPLARVCIAASGGTCVLAVAAVAGVVGVVFVVDNMDTIVDWVGSAFNYVKGLLGFGKKDVGPAEFSPDVREKMGRVLEGTTAGEDTGKKLNVRAPGTFDDANREFDELTKGLPVKDQGDGIRSATLSDGTKVTVRPHSTKKKGDQPTLEIQPTKGKRIEKRYDKPQ